jgi:hypothetical protein
MKRQVSVRSRPLNKNPEGLIWVDTVEKLGVLMMVMAVTSHLARGDLLDVPSAVQMMDFVG